MGNLAKEVEAQRERERGSRHLSLDDDEQVGDRAPGETHRHLTFRTSDRGDLAVLLSFAPSRSAGKISRGLGF
jgi:hypothetical protein